MKKRRNKIRAENIENGYDGRGHGHEQEHSEPALCGVHADLALNFEALADYVGQVVENLGEGAARLALQHDGSDEEFYVHQGNALGEIHEGIAHWHAEFLLFIELAEFA